MKIIESTVYVISQLIIFWVQGNSSGKRQNVAETFAQH